MATPSSCGTSRSISTSCTPKCLRAQRRCSFGCTRDFSILKIDPNRRGRSGWRDSPGNRAKSYNQSDELDREVDRPGLRPEDGRGHLCVSAALELTAGSCEPHG